MSLAKRIYSDLQIDSSVHAEELERGVVEYGEVDPPYYEDMWPDEDELTVDAQRSDSVYREEDKNVR